MAEFERELIGVAEPAFEPEIEGSAMAGGGEKECRRARPAAKVFVGATHSKVGACAIEINWDGTGTMR